MTRDLILGELVGTDAEVAVEMAELDRAAAEMYAEELDLAEQDRINSMLYGSRRRRVV